MGRLRVDPQRPRQVAVLVETSYVFGRRVLQGIVSYQRQHAPWAIVFRPHNRGDAPPSWLRDWQGDGIITRCYDQRMADALHATGLPVVDLSYNREGHGLPHLVVDNRPIVDLAFQYLWDLGLRNFAFCGIPKGRNSTMDERQQMFAEAVRAAGRECHLFAAHSRWQTAGTWGFDKEPLAEWLQQLPKPIGIMACHDPRGQQILEACQFAGVRSPDQVAVLGVDNDHLLCELSSPPLSSVEVDHFFVGFRAAEVLQELMHHRTRCRFERVVATPLRVVARQSTDLLTIDDAEIAKALRFIREKARGPLAVADVLREIPLSRSMLERRMKRAIGRTPKAEILRIQLEWVQEMLTDTDLSLEVIARRLGSEHPQHLATLFKRKMGQTPGEFRRRNRHINGTASGSGTVATVVNGHSEQL